MLPGEGKNAVHTGQEFTCVHHVCISENRMTTKVFYLIHLKYYPWIIRKVLALTSYTFFTMAQYVKLQYFLRKTFHIRCWGQQPGKIDSCLLFLTRNKRLMSLLYRFRIQNFSSKFFKSVVNTVCTIKGKRKMSSQLFWYFSQLVCGGLATHTLKFLFFVY